MMIERPASEGWVSAPIRELAQHRGFDEYKKFQYACLVRDERMALVWHDDLQQIIPHATRLEEKLLSLVS